MLLSNCLKIGTKQIKLPTTSCTCFSLFSRFAIVHIVCNKHYGNWKINNKEILENPL